MRLKKTNLILKLFLNNLNFRKEHAIKVNTFCEWLNELDSKVNKFNVVPNAAIEDTLRKLHLLAEEHSEKQSLFVEIADDFKRSDDASMCQPIVQFKVFFFLISLIFLSFV